MRIVDDCREESRRNEDGNPLIKLGNGEYIWWIECWFDAVYKWDNFSLAEAEDWVRTFIESVLSTQNGIPWSNDD